MRLLSHARQTRAISTGLFDRYTAIGGHWPCRSVRKVPRSFPGAMYEDWRTRGLLLGDSGYPFLLYLTPITRPTTDNERHYNRSHIMARNIIERLFGVLKQFLRRFACLHFGLRTKLSTRLIIIIVPCCVLHNIARRHREIHIRC